MNPPESFVAPLSEDLAAGLAAARGRLGAFAARVDAFASVGSTNDVAATLAASGAAEGTTIIAGQQTNGRGRRGHTWFSPPDSGLYVSVVLRPAGSDAARTIALLTLAAGVAVAEGIRAASGLPATIKWPNDILCERRKLAGILAEAAGATSGGVQTIVLGYGINVRAAAYPPALASRATCIEAEVGRPVDRGLVLGETLAALAGRYSDLVSGRFDAMLGAWRALAPSCRGAAVEWATPDGPRRGRTDGIDDRGALLVRTGSGLERVIAGEVTWL